MISFFSKFKQNNKLRKQNALDLIPKVLVKHSIDAGGKVTLHVLRFKYRSLSKLFNKSEYFNVKFDEMGSQTWLLIDGKRNIEQISTALAGNDQPFDETARRVTTFLTDLYRKDLVLID